MPAYHDYIAAHPECQRLTAGKAVQTVGCTNQHTEQELKLIRDMRRRNPNAGFVVFWVKLRQRGYSRSISGLYRVLRRMGGMAIKLPNPNSSSLFLRHVVAAFPYAIECVQTDNGPEFTNRLNPSGTTKQTLFETTLAELGIRHKLIRPYTPRHNGKVEHSHRKGNEEFYATHKFYSFEDFKSQLARRQRQYNNFPIRPLNWRSPKQALSSFPNSVTHH